MARVFSVSNARDFTSALAAAQGGDTIELAGGHYGELSLNGAVSNVNFETPITIVSADPKNQAVIWGLDVRDASNIIFDNLIFDYQFQDGDVGWLRPFSVIESVSITFSNSSFIGDVAQGVSEIYDGYGTAYGLTVNSSQDIKIEGNYFETWAKGLIFDQVTGLQVNQNEVLDIREDGMNFILVDSIDVVDNYIHDLRAHIDDPSHRDMIQLWVHPTHTETSSNINIIGNVLDIGGGVYAQGIFMRNGFAETNPDDKSMYWQNVRIEDNAVYTNHTHGITVGETVNLSVQNNTVVQVDDVWLEKGGNMAPLIHIAENSESVILSKNIVADLTGYSDQKTWNVNSNVLTTKQDILDSFVASSTEVIEGAHRYYTLPDSLAGSIGAGSKYTSFPSNPDSVQPFFQVYTEQGASGGSLIFDASLTLGPEGFLEENDADFQWTFSDGSTASGVRVKHEFSTAGYHDVKLSVVSKDGTTAEARFSAAIAGNELVQFDAQAGQFEALTYGLETPLDSSAANIVQTDNRYVLKLGGDGVQAKIAKAELSGFFNTDAFQLDMSIKSDNANSWGEVALVHMSLRTFVDQNGDFGITLFLDDGSRVDVLSDGVNMSDGSIHNVHIRFDGVLGIAEIIIDGEVAGAKKVFGALGGDSRDLMFGNPWGNQKFDGELSAFSLSVETQDYPVYQGKDYVNSAEWPDGTEGGTGTTSPDASGEVGKDNETDTPAEPETPQETPASEEDAGLHSPLLLEGYELDIADIQASNSKILHADAHVSEVGGGHAIVLDGHKDYVSVGRLKDYEESQKLSFSVDFVKGSDDGRSEILVWNHHKVGLALEADGLRVYAQNADDHFSKGFQIESLGLNDGQVHSATVMVDAEADRLQVFVDKNLVFEENDTDFDFVGAEGHEWGWTLSSAWSKWFEGEVHDFRVSDDVNFFDAPAENDMYLS